MAAGTLYLVATPIGNLEDITLRAVRILKECDLIAAEDTRVTRKLLTHFEITKPMTSYFAPREMAKALELVAMLKQGKNIALTTDAGTPGVSDPGHVLVLEALKQGCPVVPVPGASAVLSALTASGLPPQPFYFHGFLPAKASERRRELEPLRDLTATLVFYESPHRVLECLADLAQVLGDREAAAGRELTKLHEEMARGTLSSLLKTFEERGPRGEFTLVVAGADPSDKVPEWQGLSVEQHLKSVMEQGKSLNEAIALVARLRKLDRKDVYKTGHAMQGGS